MQSTVDQWVSQGQGALNGKPGEFKPAAVDSGFHGAFRQAQSVGDFLIRKLLQIAQDDGLAQRGRQLGERHADPLPQIDLLQFAVRAALP